MFASSRTYRNHEFLRLVAEGKLEPERLRGVIHLHWILVRGRPRWVYTKRASDACGTVRCSLEQWRSKHE